MKRYYYFCHSCGGDTATYERITVCPYCHAHTPKFALIDEAEATDKAGSFPEYLKSLRQRWEEENPKKERGAAQRKRRRLLREKQHKH